MTGRQLVELDETWAAAAATDDLDAVMAYWTDDAVMYPEGLPSLHGKPAIRQFLASRRSKPGYRISWMPSCAGVDERGSMAYTLGEAAATIVDDAGSTRDLNGRYVAIWRRESGQWRCAVKCWNSSPREGTTVPEVN